MNWTANFILFVALTEPFSAVAQTPPSKLKIESDTYLVNGIGDDLNPETPLYEDLDMTYVSQNRVKILGNGVYRDDLVRHSP